MFQASSLDGGILPRGAGTKEQIIKFPCQLVISPVSIISGVGEMQHGPIRTVYVDL